MQIVMAAFLSVAYGARNAHASMGILAMVISIHETGSVPVSADMGIMLRCVCAAGTAIGTLFLGKRLAPITGDSVAFLNQDVFLEQTSVVCMTSACLHPKKPSF